MSAIAELKERRNALAAQMTEIDAVLRQLGASGAKRVRGKASTGNGARSEAAKRMWATRRANAAKEPKPKNKVQAKRNVAHPRQSVVPQKPQGASLAAAAEG